MDRRPITEIGVCALIAIICAVALGQALKLPPGRFEPLGSGPVPIWTASVIIVCCVIVAVRALLHLRKRNLSAVLQHEFSGGNPMGGLLVLALTFAYVGALHMKLAGFGIVTFIYLVMMITGMSGFSRRSFVPAIIVAAVAAFGAQYVFTEIFVVDLPV